MVFDQSGQTVVWQVQASNCQFQLEELNLDIQQFIKRLKKTNYEVTPEELKKFIAFYFGIYD